MTASLRARRSRVPALIIAAALVAGCGSGKNPTPEALPTNPALPATSTPTATPTPSPTEQRLVSPLTGLPVDKLRPVIAVKVDNALLARPHQRGLDEADIVYEEVVEGRTTRFVAMFSSRSAKEIGPVRSVRESDIPLLAMFGKVAFSFSGGNRGVLSTVRKSNVIDVSYDARPGAYTIAGRRKDAFNYITGSDRLLALAPSSAVAKDIGLRFGTLPANVTRSGVSASVVWSKYAHTQWRWDAKRKVYLRSMDGRPAMLRNGHQQSSPNVLLQFVKVRNSRYSDTNGTVSPYTTTTGGGKAVLLRDGKTIVGTWKRDGLGATHFIERATGKDMLLHTGPVWVMLVPDDLNATIR